MSRIIVDAIRNSSASSDGITLSSDGKVTFPNTSTGKILQVLQTVKTDTFTSNSNSLIDITGLSISITPSATNSKILVFVSFNHQVNNVDRWSGFQLIRDSTAIYRGDADSSRTRASIHTSLITGSGDGSFIQNSLIQFLDSPNTTSSTTYKLQGQVQSGGSYFVINRPRNNADADYIGRTASSITVQEVAA